MKYPTVDTLLFFGSFDPVTLGHEAIIQAGIDVLSPREVLLIPANEEGWGKRLSSFAQRQTMIELAVFTHPDWKGIVGINTVERDAHLSGITADTLHFLLEHGFFGKRLGFLMGADWILSFPTWEEWEWMLLRAPAFVALRGEETEASLRMKLHRELMPSLGKTVFFLPEEKTRATKHISSTIVRTSVRIDGHTEFVSPEVLSYVKTHHLYTT